MEKKGRDVPGEEEKQHLSLGDGGGALSEVAGMARKPKTGKKWRYRARGKPRRRRTSLERCWKWPEVEPRAVTRRRVGDSPEEKSGA